MIDAAGAAVGGRRRLHIALGSARPDPRRQGAETGGHVVGPGWCRERRGAAGRRRTGQRSGAGPAGPRPRHPIGQRQRQRRRGSRGVDRLIALGHTETTSITRRPVQRSSFLLPNRRLFAASNGAF